MPTPATLGYSKCRIIWSSSQLSLHNRQMTCPQWLLQPPSRTHFRLVYYIIATKNQRRCRVWCYEDHKWTGLNLLQLWLWKKNDLAHVSQKLCLYNVPIQMEDHIRYVCFISYLLAMTQFCLGRTRVVVNPVPASIPASSPKRKRFLLSDVTMHKKFKNNWARRKQLLVILTDHFKNRDSFAVICVCISRRVLPNL